MLLFIKLLIWNLYPGSTHLIAVNETHSNMINKYNAYICDILTTKTNIKVVFPSHYLLSYLLISY